MTMARRSVLSDLLGRSTKIIRDPKVKVAVQESEDLLRRNAVLVAELAGVERALAGEIRRGESSDG